MSEVHLFGLIIQAPRFPQGARDLPCPHPGSLLSVSCATGLGSFPRLRAFFAPQLFFWLSAWFSAIASMESDSSEELVRALSLCRVPEALATQIAQAYETPSDFAFTFPQLPD